MKILLSYRLKDHNDPGIGFRTVDVSNWDDSELKEFCLSPFMGDVYGFRQSDRGAYTHFDPVSKLYWKPGLGPWNEETFQAATEQCCTGLRESIEKCHTVLLGWQRDKVQMPTAKEAYKEWPQLMKRIQTYEQLLLMNGLL